MTMTDEEYTRAVLQSPALNLATTGEMLATCTRRLAMEPIEEFRVLADMLQSIQNILQVSDAGRAALAYAPLDPIRA